MRGVAIGAGYFSHFHYDAWTRIDGAEIVALCDREFAKATEVAGQFAIARVFDDYRRMLDEVQPDFVDIITRPDTHLEIVGEAVERGIPIICQKPLAPTADEARKIVEVADRAGVPLMVHENFRFQPWYRFIKQVFDSGRIGDKLHTLSFRNRAGDGWGDDAYLARQPYFQTMEKFLIFEAGIHTVDTFRYLAGEVHRVWCTTRKLNPVIAGEDNAMAVFEFEGGGIGQYDANRYNESTAQNPRYTFGEFLLEANGGSLRLYADGRVTIQPLGEEEVDCDFQPSTDGFAGDCVFSTQKHFVEMLSSGGDFETSGRDYLKSIAVQEAMYRSAESGTWEVPTQD
ncbi:MAG: Gfo/Idh/MocA family oxidoreductase [Aureliella sp.]